MKRKIIVSAAALCLAFAVPAAANAAQFRDISESYWAYDAIQNITSRGLMMGDLSGNFNPDSFIDKYDTSVIFAKVLGYNYNSASQQDKTYYDSIYESRKGFINQYAKTFSRWNSSSDREIAFLLEKGILLEEDLNQFVIKDSSGKEQLRALSREEAAVFLVRLMGKQKDAQTISAANKFSDDSSIAQNKRQEVYYLKSVGIISGNTDGRFNPNSGVTRADFCVLLDKALTYMGKNISVDKSAADTSAPAGAIVNNIETVSGYLDKYFPSLNVVQLSVGQTQKLYRVVSGAEVKINGFNGSLSELKEGMSITAVLNNSEIVQLSASGASSTGTAEEVGQPSQETVQAPSTSEPAADISSQSPETAPSESDLTAIVGSVESVSGNSITLKYTVLNSTDETDLQTKTYTLSNDAVIKRNSADASLSDIGADDIVNAKVLGSKIYYIDVEEGILVLDDALIVKKYYNREKSAPAFVIEASGGKRYELYVTEDTEISRNSESGKWNDIKAGDKASVKTSLNKLESISAQGEERSLEGYITEIRMNSEGAYIGFSANENDTDYKLYPVNRNTVDLYSIKIGDKVKLFLDSDEIETVNIRKSSDSNTVTGYINTVKSSYITVETSDSYNSSRKKIEIDDDTLIVSSVTGKTLKVKELDEDMKVYIVFDEDSAKLAKTITVLSNNR